MAYIGSTPETQSFTSGTDYFNGNGSSTAFTLSRTVASVNDIEVVISNVVQQPSTAYNVSGTTITFTSAPPSGTANVYVRYLSTITQTITPSPGTVGTSQLSPSLTNIPLFGGSTLGAGNATGMKNRIINGGMTISQRGTSFSSLTSSQFCLDRFSADIGGGGAITVTQSSTAPNGFINSMSCTVATADASIGSTDAYRISHMVEGLNTSDLGWGTVNAKTVTLSFWVRSSVTGTYGLGLANSAETENYVGTYTISSADTWERKTIVVPGDTTGTWLTTNGIGIGIRWDLGSGSNYNGSPNTWQTTGSKVYRTSGSVNWISTSGATFYITGVQLEEGNAATSFDFRDYGRELALCQRYFQSWGGTAAFEFIGVGCSQASNNATIVLPTQVQMRSAPSVSVSSASHFRVFNGSSYLTATAVAANSASTQVCGIDVSTASGISTGTFWQFGANNSTSARLQLSSEL